MDMLFSRNGVDVVTFIPWIICCLDDYTFVGRCVHFGGIQAFIVVYGRCMCLASCAFFPPCV